MKRFKDKVAIVTGAANGIGLAIAEQCVRERMKVVLADIDETALENAERKLLDAGGTILAVRTDVTRIEDVQSLAQLTLDTFGGIHLLCNNAGLSTYKRSWHMTLADWQWVIGVNLWGVIHGIHVFLPVMLEQNQEAHIVNTASEAGIIGGRRNMAGYYATKSAVIALSESLYHELAEVTDGIHVSVFIPGLVRSSAWDPDRYRPMWLQNTKENNELPEETQDYETFKQRSRQLFESDLAMDAEQAVDILFQGIRENKLYLRTHHGTKEEIIRARIDDLLQGINPVDRIPAFREKLMK
ncbi:MAG: SDR family NAD(P)-dependent oxidoreductase [Anaerolineales bacterium]|nr:SDR family NAD(P)-dependent oxidoreductase [Anaerolineales bacterium]